MAFVTEILATLFVLIGLIFMFLGALGVVRLPDLYNRLHAASKCSTLGLLGLLLGAVLHMGTVGLAAKALMVMLFAFVATPVGSHMLAKAALRTHTPTWPGTKHDAEARKTDNERDAAPAENPPGRAFTKC
jgi:multicomponent Na+:H+ antiporter subunit G